MRSTTESAKPEAPFYGSASLSWVMRAFFALASVLVLSSCRLIDLIDVAPATAGERIERQVTVGNTTRTYVAHLPTDLSSRQNTRVLIAYHPALADGAFMENATRLHEASGAENFIVVYPDGVRRTWNAESCCGLANRLKVDDLGFFDAMMADLGKIASIRPKAYVTGYSNGALMAYHLVCNRPERIAAAATFAAYLPPETIAACPPGPVPLLHLHGDADEGAPVEGGMTQYLGYLPPARDTILAVARRNQCDLSSPVSVTDPKLGTTCTRYEGCADGAVAEQCTIPNLGHVWPGGTPVRGGAGRFGPSRPDLDGSGAVISFFLQH